MKTIYQYSIWVMAAVMAVSCSELKDNDHYGNSDTPIANSELKIVDMTSQEYISSRSDLSEMNNLFSTEGIYDELKQKGQLSTMLVVTNEHFQRPAERVDFITRSHVSDISISPANLENGTRLMMWHGKYVNVTIDDLGLQGNIIDHIMFNNGAVKEVIKTQTGYIYVISEMIETPTSLYDFINELGDDYSIFREMVLSSGGKEFDRANSKAVGMLFLLISNVVAYLECACDALDFLYGSVAVADLQPAVLPEHLHAPFDGGLSQLACPGMGRHHVLKFLVEQEELVDGDPAAIARVVAFQASRTPPCLHVLGLNAKSLRHLRPHPARYHLVLHFAVLAYAPDKPLGQHGHKG